MKLIDFLKLCLSLSSLFFGYVLAAIPPTSIALGNNESASVILSDTNINRVLVEGDQISHITCPQNLCAAEHHEGDLSGAFYVNLMTQNPFTIFVSTHLGRHFSLQVTPQMEAGQTLLIEPIGGSLGASYWEKSSYYQILLCAVIRDMMQGRVPRGYGYHSLENKKPTYFKHLASLQPEGLWVGNHIEGVKYQIFNDEKEPLTLPESAFYHHGVRAVALTEQTIPIGGSAYLFEVISGGDSYDH